MATRPTHTLLTVIMIAVAIVSFSKTAMAQGEHGRRVGSEIRVMLADAIKLSNDNTSSQHRRGLQDRIRGGLAGLSFLARKAGEERPQLPSLSREDISNLNSAISSGNIDVLIRGLTALTKMFPLSMAGVLPTNTSPAGLRRAASIDQSYCASCHETPDIDMERPAFSLRDMARQMPLEEFVARLMMGVRGDSLTGVENPMTDQEISALISYYTTIN